MSIVGKSTKVYSGFAPTQIPGCALWLDAADPSSLTLSGSNVTTWRDKSGNGNHTSGSSGTTTYRTNGISTRGSLYFNSTYLTGGFASTFTGTEMSCFIVASVSSSSSQYSRLLSLGRPGVADQDSTSTCIPFVKNAGAAQIYAVNNNVGTTPNNVTYDSPFLSRTYFLSNLIANNLNGNTTFNTVSTTASFNITSYGLGISTSTADASRYTGEICEIICYFGSSLTTSQAQQIEGYLAQKWGVSSKLPGTHPFGLSIAPAPLYTRPINPLDIAGCALWLDAADAGTLTLSGSNVTQWNDKSGNGYNFTAPATSNQPSYGVFNGFSGLSFNGSTNYLSNATTIQSGTGGRNTFIVFYDTGTVSSIYGQPGCMFINATPSYASGNVWMCAFSGSSNAIGIDVVNGVRLLSTSPPVTSMLTTRCIAMWGMPSGATVSTAYVYGNGVQFTSALQSTGTTQAINTGTGGGTTIASYPAVNWFAKIVVSEVLHFSTELTTTQRQQVEAYLAWKWGLSSSVATSHPFKRFPSLMTTFSPTQIPGALVWLDAMDNTTLSLSGTSVISIRDKVRNALFTPSGATSLATLQPNTIQNNQSIFIDNTGSSRTSLTTLMSAPSVFSAFLVWKNVFQPTRSYEYIYAWYGGAYFNPGSFAYGFFGSQTGGTLGIWDTYSGGGGTTLALANQTNYIGYTQYPSSVLSLNGNTPSSRPLTVSTVGTVFAIGSTPMYLGEIILYDTNLSTAQRQQVEGYLAWKWGLVGSLPSTHPYKKFTP